MKLYIGPKTPSGKWSVILIGVFFVLLAMFYILVASGQRGGETFFSNLVLTIPAILMGTSGILAFLTGVISIIISKEWSILVFLSTIFGLFILIFILGEILFPH